MGAANICQQVVKGDQFENFASYEELAQATRGARLVFDTLVQSIARAEQRAGPSSEGDLAGFLQQRTVADQLLRHGFEWGLSEVTDTRTPKLTTQERAAFTALLNSEILYVDHRNTQWLKRLVTEEGWPTVSKAGERGSGAAWLLVQHADLDPAFQLEMLRLMEPLVPQGEVSKRNYAYLYDRIMLKLNGKQRYATQVMCENGERVARPLEVPERMDQLRAEMELEPFAEYLTWFSGRC